MLSKRRVRSELAWISEMKVMDKLGGVSKLRG